MKRADAHTITFYAKAIVRIGDLEERRGAISSFEKEYGLAATQQLKKQISDLWYTRSVARATA